MKRVLFYYDNICTREAKGGTEIATFRIAKALSDTGNYLVYDAYRNNSSSEADPLFTASVKLSKYSDKIFIKRLSEFILRNDIDVVVNMSRFFRHLLIYKAIKKSQKEVKLIFMQHFAPGSESKKYTYKAGFHLLKLNPMNPVYWLRASLYPLFKLPRRLALKKIYRLTYNISDSVILLSDGYFEDYCKIGGFSDVSKFTAIPNIFEPEDLPSHDSSSPKEKRVLIMSRMDEIQKRLSLALKIWQKIEQNPDLFDWHLDIVGSGHNMDIVKRLVRKMGLQNVTIHGWREPDTFLRKSSIIIMTSEYEGLPLSILEAQSFGCIPIAYNSFASLKDVVQPYFNGVIVEKFGDIEDYTKKLTELMYDSVYREDLSNNAMRMSGRFSSKKIAQKWNKILT